MYFHKIKTIYLNFIDIFKFSAKSKILKLLIIIVKLEEKKKLAKIVKFIVFFIQ